MMALPFLLALGLGALLLCCICQDKIHLNTGLFYPLAFGLGLCACTLCVYLSFLIQGKFNPTLILNIYGALVLIMSMIGGRYYPLQKHIQSIKRYWALFPLLIPFGLLIYCAILVADYQPFGAWDAWGVYNLKFRFLVLGQEHWTLIFNDLHRFTQPDYPLMLPFIYTWIYTFTKDGLNFIPKLFGIVLYLHIGLLLIGGLVRYVPKYIALLAGFILWIIPFFIYVATAQYADVLLASVLLMSLILLLLFCSQPNLPTSLLAGLLLGWLSFVKNEGVVCMLVLYFLVNLYLLFSRQGSLRKRAAPLFPFGISVFAGALPTLIFKFFLAPRNTDIFSGIAFSEMKYFNAEGIHTVFQFTVKEFSQQHWSFCWVFLGLLAILNIKHLFHREQAIPTLFFISYSLILIFIYLTTARFDLTWRLENTLPRILFYLLPSAFFSVTLWSFRHEKISAS